MNMSATLTWNTVMRVIAANKLGLNDIEAKARANLKLNGRSSALESLRVYLPELLVGFEL